MEKVLVLEETDQVVESLLGQRNKILGRANGYVPGEGEITYDIVRGIVGRIMTEMGYRKMIFLLTNLLKKL